MPFDRLEGSEAVGPAAGSLMLKEIIRRNDRRAITVRGSYATFESSPSLTS